jgi:hypothetical protein
MPMPRDAKDRREQRATYLTLIGLFFSLFAAFSRRERERGDDPRLRPFDFALLGLATYRAGRLAAYDKVTEPLRAPFTETKEDESGAGETVEAKGTGFRKALGELLSCPTCAGTWAAALLVFGLRLAPRFTRLLLTILGATGIAELLDAGAEALTWTSQTARKEAGS